MYTWLGTLVRFDYTKGGMISTFLELIPPVTIREPGKQCEHSKLHYYVLLAIHDIINNRQQKRIFRVFLNKTPYLQTKTIFSFVIVDILEY